jgi:alkylation response protein AidB-like acyl-CoA dehydrogenase
MDFTFSDEQRMGAEVVRQVLAEHCNSAMLLKQLQAGLDRDEGAWQELRRIGLMGVMMPESVGGLGLGEVDFVLVAEACGYAALPGPFVEHTGVAGPLLSAVGVHGGLTEKAAAGEIAVAIGHPTNPSVAEADAAEALLLEYQGEVHLVLARDVKLTRQASIDPFRRLFQAEWTPSEGTRVANRLQGQRLWDDALDRGALFTAAQCLGIAQRTVDLSVEYAKTRKQFGKPIGSYQAIKHLLASVQVKIEFARPVLYAAAAGLSHRDCCSRAAVSHAKWVSAEAAELGTQAALQVHGAMGYSWEVDVHLFLKRALVLNGAWGTQAFHRERVTQRVLTQFLGPDHTFTRELEHA